MKKRNSRVVSTDAENTFVKLKIYSDVLKKQNKPLIQLSIKGGRHQTDKEHVWKTHSCSHVSSRMPDVFWDGEQDEDLCSQHSHASLHWKAYPVR